MFLILGSQNLTIDNRNTLGQLDISIFDDYYKLCEYVNYHSNEFFILNFGEKNELYRSVADMQMETNNNDYIKYSGVYFTNYPYKNNGKIIRLTRKHLPINIYTAKLIIANTEQINLGIVKDKNIFENGKFIGPSIVEEDKFSY